MALDIHRLDTGEHLLSLDDAQLALLADVLARYTQRTGLRIDPYADSVLSCAQLHTLLAVMDQWAAQADLNRQRPQAVAVLGLRGVLALWAAAGHDVRLVGD
ncbi:MAG: hypothetical protein Q4F13_14445 [Pseudomonadota bacterium]|nr:hypothetical protein [Pseudomonadota bacterium]